jgi:hypothetical protein
MNIEHATCNLCKRKTQVYAYTSYKVKIFYLCLDCMSVVLQKAFMFIDGTEFEELLQDDTVPDMQDPCIQTR